MTALGDAWMDVFDSDPSLTSLDDTPGGSPSSPTKRPAPGGGPLGPPPKRGPLVVKSAEKAPTIDDQASSHAKGKGKAIDPPSTENTIKVSSPKLPFDDDSDLSGYEDDIQVD